MSTADRIGRRPNYDDFVYVISLSGCRLGALLGVKLFDSSTAEWLEMSVQPPWLPSSHRSELSNGALHAACQCAAILPPQQQWLSCHCSSEIRTLQGEIAQPGSGSYRLDCRLNRACGHASCHPRFCSPLCVNSGALQGSVWPKNVEDKFDESLSVGTAHAVLRPKRYYHRQAGHPFRDSRASVGTFCGINVFRWCDRSSSKTEY